MSRLVLCFLLTIIFSFDDQLPFEHLTTLENGSVDQPVWSPDGKTLAATGSLGVWLFDVDDLTAEPRLFEDYHSVVAFHPNSQWAASLDRDRNIALWDVETGEKVRPLYETTPQRPVTAFAFHPEGTLFALASLSPDSKGRILILNFETGNEIITLENDIIWALEFSPDGKWLAAGTDFGFFLYDTAMWEVMSGDYPRRVGDISFNGSSTQGVYFDNYNRAIGQFKIDGTAAPFQFPETSIPIHPIAVTFHPRNDDILAVSERHGVWIVNTASQAVLTILPFGFDTAFNPDGTRLAYSDGSRLLVYETTRYTQVAALGDFNKEVRGMRFSDDSQMLAYERTNKTIGLWDQRRLPDSRVVVSVNHSDTAQLEQFATSFHPNDFRTMLDEGYAVSFTLQQVTQSPRPDLRIRKAKYDCLTFVYQPDLTVKIENAETGELLHTLEGHHYPVCEAEISPDGQILVTADNDDLSFAGNHSVRVWDLDTGEQIAQLLDASGSISLRDVVFSPDGRWLGVVMWTRIDLWDTSTWTLVNSISDYQGGYEQLILANDGIMMFRTHWGDVQFVNIETGEQLMLIDDHQVANMLLSPDGTLLALATENGTVEIWGKRN